MLFKFRTRLSWYMALSLFVASFLSSCQSKDTPFRSRTKSEKENLEVALSIYPSSCFITYRVTKGYEPNIYRDGTLVSQGDYTSLKEQVNRHTYTSFQHQGSRLKVTVTLTPYYSFMYVTPSIHAVLYRNGRKISDFEKSYELRPHNGSAIIDFEVYAQETR